MIGVVRKEVDAGGCEEMMCTVIIVLNIMRDYIHTLIVNSLLFCLVHSRRERGRELCREGRGPRRGRATPQDRV